MSEILGVPHGLAVFPRDGAVLAKWEAVEGAEGYKLFYYAAEEPDKCIKTRYAQHCSKLILGFQNGREYLVSVRAFRSMNGKEILGEASERVGFVPISEKLKAQNTICLDVGETAQLEWEYRNTVPEADFESEDISIASVDDKGRVTALAEGETHVIITAEGQSFDTKIAVMRRAQRGVNKAVMMFTGDIMCAVNHQRAAGKLGYDFHDAFDRIKPTLAEADFSVGVLETTCYDGAPYECEELRLGGGSPNCNSPSSFLSAVADAGFDALVTANNHNCDTGRKGLEATAAEINRLGMRNLGTLGNNPVITVIRGIKVAFICFSMISNGLDSRFFAGSGILIGRYTRDDFLERVNAAMRMGAEYIVSYIHWGGMNTAIVRKSQREEARFMAEAGVDLIVGSHPHVVQKFEYIKSSSGKRVPCAYSLGNFLTSMSEMKENRDSVILRAELTRNSDGKVQARLSYIPCICEDADYGVSVRPSFPFYSMASKESFLRTKAALGKAINHFRFRPLVLLSGSVILDSIFSAGSALRADKAGVLISQLAVCGQPDYEIPETRSGILRTDLEKSLPEHMKQCGADYIAVDFYTAAGVSCYRLGDNLFTGSKKFLKSRFYSEHKEGLTRLRPPFDEELWKGRLRDYSQAVLSAFPNNRVILFRHRFPNKLAKETELRDAPLRSELNARMRQMEDYFISLVKPMVVDLSADYFTAGKSPSAFEQEYFTDCYNAACGIISGNGRSYVHIQDSSLWFGRVMKYYDNMIKRGYQSWLLDMSGAADNIIACTNKEFAAENSQRLIKLKKIGSTELMSVRSFFADDKGAEELIEAAELIYAVQQGNLSGPYEFYELAFKRKFNILKQMARLLQTEIGVSVNEESAELVFLLRGKHQLRRYVSQVNGITVDIWGSCVSREAVGRSRGVLVGKYIFKQSQALAFEPPVSAALPDKLSMYGGSKWRRRTIIDAFNRSGMNTVSESSSKWLLVDFYDIICRLADYKGDLFEIDDFITRTAFYRSIEPECRECYLFERRDMKYLFKMISLFAREMSAKYGENIILLKAEPKDTYVTLDGRTKELSDDGMFDIRKKLIALCEERFAGLTGCYVIDISRRFLASDKFPLGGAHIVHYEDEFYRQAGEYISEIVRGTSKKVLDGVDENYLLLRSMKANR